MAAANLDQSSRSQRRAAGIPWQQRPRLQLTLAEEVSGLWAGTLRRAESQGKLIFVRLEGRVLVDTASLIAFLATAEPYKASNRGEAGRRARAENSSLRWRS